MDIACYQSSEMKLGPIGCEVHVVDQTEYCLNIVIMQRTTRVAGGLTLVYVCMQLGWSPWLPHVLLED